MVNIKFVDFPSEYKSIKKEIDSAIKRVLESGIFVLGPEVSVFEKEIAKFVGVKYAVGLASGTDALTIALKSLGLKEGDEVIVPANVYPTVFGVARSGVKIRLCDVNPETLNIDLENIKKVYTKKTKAIVAVHLYGNPFDIDPIKKFAKQNKIFLVEDCAQAAGSIYKGKVVGSFGDVSCFSFYPTKNLGAYGDGGALLTNNVEVFKNALLWRMYGEQKRYDSVLVGLNSRLDEIQAAILRVKLNHVRKWNKARGKIAERYLKSFKNSNIETLGVLSKSQSNYHLFVIKSPDRDNLIDFLKQNGIPSVVHYPMPIHLTESFKYLKYKKGDFPVSEESCKEVLSLPIYPAIPVSHVDLIANCVKNFYTQNK